MVPTFVIIMIVCLKIITNKETTMHMHVFSGCCMKDQYGTLPPGE